MEVYDRVAKVVAPKKESLAIAQQELAVQMEKLNTKRAELKSVCYMYIHVFYCSTFAFFTHFLSPSFYSLLSLSSLPPSPLRYWTSSSHSMMSLML